MRPRLGGMALIVNFDEERWSQLDEYLKVARVCGEGAGDLLGLARGVSQRVVATIGSDKDVSPAEAEHALNVLSALWNVTVDAARGYAAAVARVEDLMRQFDPAGPKPRPKGAKS